MILALMSLFIETSPRGIVDFARDILRNSSLKRASLVNFSKGSVSPI